MPRFGRDQARVFVDCAPIKDKDAIRRAAERHIKPVFRRGIEMLRQVIENGRKPTVVASYKKRHHSFVAS